MAIDIVDDVDALFGLDPLVRLGEAGIGADDGDDAVSGGLDAVGLLEKEIEDGAKIFAAAGVEAGGACVAVDGGDVERRIIAELIVDGFRAVPVDEKVLDGFAFGVAADFAFAAMMLEIGIGSGFNFAFQCFRSAKRGFCAGRGDGLAFFRR